MSISKKTAAALGLLALVILVFFIGCSSKNGTSSTSAEAGYNYSDYVDSEREAERQAEEELMEGVRQVGIDSRAEEIAWWSYINNHGVLSYPEYFDGDDKEIYERAEVKLSEMLAENPLDDPDNPWLAYEESRRLHNEIIPDDGFDAPMIGGMHIGFNQYANIIQCYDYFNWTMKYSEQQAAVFAAAMFKASYADEDACTADEGSFGLFMLSGSRLDELKSTYPKSYQTVTTQLRFIGSDNSGWSGGKSFDSLRESETVEEASKLICKNFLRFPQDETESVSAIAYDILAMFGK
ncbi:MAG: hypothetical protein LBM97_02065 [Candidatus Nomurabacteria bacterium]|jgi:hypothetical protein|nr:hypothetical protein [Candidatus Nomurabacteria bacterium]